MERHNILIDEVIEACISNNCNSIILCDINNYNTISNVVRACMYNRAIVIIYNSRCRIADIYYAYYDGIVIHTCYLGIRYTVPYYNNSNISISVCFILNIHIYDALECEGMFNCLSPCIYTVNKYTDYVREIINGCMGCNKILLYKRADETYPNTPLFSGCIIFLFNTSNNRLLVATNTTNNVVVSTNRLCNKTIYNFTHRRFNMLLISIKSVTLNYTLDCLGMYYFNI